MFVHSGLMDSRAWKPQFEAFAEGRMLLRDRDDVFSGSLYGLALTGRRSWEP